MRQRKNRLGFLGQQKSMRMRIQSGGNGVYHLMQTFICIIILRCFFWHGVALWARAEYLREDGVVMARFLVGIISGGMEDPLGLM